MNINNITKNDLKYFGYREELYFVSGLMISGWFNKKRLLEVFGLKTGVRWLQVNFELFEVEKDLLAWEKQLKAILKKGGIKFIKRLNKECIKSGEKLIEASKTASRKSATGKKENLSVLLRDYRKYIEHYVVFMAMAVFEKPILEIAENLTKRVCGREGDSDHILKIITTPLRQTAVEHEQEEFMKIAASNVSDKRKLAKMHAKKYGWLAIRYFLGEPWTAKDVLDRLSRISQKNTKESLDKKIKANELLDEEVESVLKNLNKKDQDLVNIIREVIYLRNQRADFFSEAAYYARPFLFRIASVLGVAYEQLLNLSADEIILSLKGKFDFKKHINDRIHGFVVFHNAKRTVIYDGKDFDKYIEGKKFLLMQTANTNEFKGYVAFKGKVRGKVKIVRSEKDLKKVEKGDVLVCPMTLPHFVSAMEKAVAFVTDEGGITCHAAIIAREMKKPCIIGTKVATKVLKDGDMVEVDGDKGIVRIIK